MVTEDCISQLVSVLNFEDPSPLAVRFGTNNLDSCYQYEVVDSKKNKVMNIKFYDKILDLVGRESTYTVGSRLKEIIGSKRWLDSF